MELLSTHALYSISAGLAAALVCAWVWRLWPRAHHGDLYKLSPSEFESAVGNLFQLKGFRVENIRHSGDDGIDLLLSRSGQQIAVQCKRYRQAIGPGAIREFIGTISLHGLNSGYFVTTSRFTSGAKRTARESRYKIYLVDGSQLKRWQLQQPAGVFRFWFVRLAILFDIALIVSILSYLLGPH